MSVINFPAVPVYDEEEKNAIATKPFGIPDFLNKDEGEKFFATQGLKTMDEFSNAFIPRTPKTVRYYSCSANTFMVFKKAHPNGDKWLWKFFPSKQGRKIAKALKPFEQHFTQSVFASRKQAIDYLEANVVPFASKHYNPKNLKKFYPSFSSRSCAYAIPGFAITVKKAGGWQPTCAFTILREWVEKHQPDFFQKKYATRKAAYQAIYKIVTDNKEDWDQIQKMEVFGALAKI